MKRYAYKTIPALLLALACDAPPPSPAPSAPEPPAPAPAPRAELRDGDLQLKPLGEEHGALPALERDPVGALRPAWQLLKPRFEGLESSAQVSDLSFGFCATLKEQAWFARCEGEGQPAEVAWTFTRAPGEGWEVTLEGSVRLVDWRGQEAPLRVKERHAVAAPPPALSPEAWWRALGRALTVAWLSRVDALRGGIEAPAIRWSEFRRDSPSFRPTQARALAAWAFDAQAWLLDLDPVGLARLHRIDDRGVPTLQVLQTAPLALEPSARATPDPANRRLLLALPGARELDPNAATAPALAPLQPGCEAEGCAGISLLSVDHRGKVLLAGRVKDAALAGAPLPTPGGGALVAARLASGEVALVRFARGGLEERRDVLPGAPAGAWPLAWAGEGALWVGPVEGKGGRAALWRLDTANPRAKPAPIPLPTDSVALPGAPLVADGAGGALVVVGREGGAALLRLDPRGAALWERPLPAAAGAASVWLVGDRAWVSVAGQWSALVAPGDGALLKTWEAPLESPPLPWDKDTALVCRQGRAWWLDAAGAPKAALPLAWGCRSLTKLNNGEVLAASGDPGGAYRLAPPERWPAIDEVRP